MLQCVPQCPLLRPDASEAVRPRSPELQHAVVVVEPKVPRARLLGSGFFRNVDAHRTHPPLLANVCPRGAAWCRLGQEHRDGKPFMTQELA